MYYIGIDVSKKDLSVFDGENDLKFINQEGLKSFKKYLKKKYSLSEIAIIFEPTGVYSLHLKEFCAENNIKAYIVNPVVVDELNPLARYSGHPLLPRRSIFHALNQKAVARQHARSLMQKYDDINLIVVHLGGGVTIGAHKKGRVVDVNQGLDGDGPFSPERTGTLPIGPLIRLCFSGKYTEAEILKMNKGAGGLIAYLGTNSAYEVEQRAQEGDQEAKKIFAAMAYQVAKEIGAMYAVLCGDVDGILITGGVAHSKWFVNEISQRVHKMAPVHIYPGEDEMRALAFNGLRVIRGETIAKEYI